MSARVLRFTGSQHREAERLLPWLVNGTLDDEERATIERHVGGCAHCQRELIDLRELQQAWAMPSVTPDPMPSFTRLRRRLQAPRDRPPSSRWSAARSAWTTAPLWLRGAIAAPCALLLMLGGAWFAREPPAQYRVLGDSTFVSNAAVIAAHGDARLVVVFEPSTSQARTQLLLRESRARIVDGPSDAGAYVLAVPAARAATVRDALRTAPGVSLVESLDPAAAQ